MKRQSSPDFLCILVDDGSTDDSVAVARTTIANDARFRVVDNPSPGRGRALNFGVEHCTTDWFAILDADDVAHPEWIARMLPVVTDAVAVGCRSRLFNNDQLPVWAPIDHDTQADLATVTERLVRNNPLGHSGCMLSKAAVLSVGGYDASRISQFDYDLYVRLAYAGHSIAKLQVALVGHRVHAAQSFEASRHLAYIWRSVQVQRRALLLFHGRPLQYFWPVARLAWACMPRFVRASVRR